MLSKSKLIVQDDPKSYISEAYRVLRTNIQFSDVDRKLKTIVMTSAGQGEGKSITISNLAITFAQSGSKTILIDTDLRRPRLHKMFGIYNNNGITNVIAKQGDYTHYVQQTEVNNLQVLTSGPIPPNPSELLSSNSMKTFIETLRNDYDIILFDSPPVGTVTDAAVLSTIADGVIIVAASGMVEIDALKRSKELLERINANIIGVVVNRLGRNHKENYYYYYYEEDDIAINRKNKRNKRNKKIKMS